MKYTIERKIVFYIDVGIEFEPIFIVDASFETLISLPTIRHRVMLLRGSSHLFGLLYFSNTIEKFQEFFS